MKILKPCVCLILSSLVLVGVLQFCLFNFPLPVRAESDLWNMQEGLGDGTIGQEAFGREEPQDIRIIIANIVKIFLGFLGIIFLILLIFAGFKYMTAQGNEEKIKEATGQIKTAIIGLLIILAAYSITHFITQSLSRTTTGSVW